jgi:lysozyme
MLDLKTWLKHWSTWLWTVALILLGWTQWCLLALPHLGLQLLPGMLPFVGPKLVGPVGFALGVFGLLAKPIVQDEVKARLLKLGAWIKRMGDAAGGGINYDKAKSYGVTAAMIAAALAVAQPLADRWEGYRFTPYRDGGGVWTVCKGHTGGDVVPGRTYTHDECKAFEDADRAVAVNAILNCTPTLFFNRYASGATIDFAFNVGGRAYCTSTMARLFNAGDVEGGCAQLARWSYDNHVWVRGLWNRRQDETRTCVKALS